jgi:hypothetical protein
LDKRTLQELAAFLPARDAGWTEAQACAFLARQGLRAQAASRRLLDKRDPSLALPTSREGLMAFVEMLLDQPKHHKTWVTNPERRAIRLWHRVVRAKDQAQAGA